MLDFSLGFKDLDGGIWRRDVKDLVGERYWMSTAERDQAQASQFAKSPACKTQLQSQ